MAAPANKLDEKERAELRRLALRMLELVDGAPSTEVAEPSAEPTAADYEAIEARRERRRLRRGKEG